MSLSSDLISQFVKVTNDEKKSNEESTLYGTVVEDNDNKYVKLDGSEVLTPVTTTADVNSGERVTVMIKNHTATITGNMSSPAARTGDVQELGDQITEVDRLVAGKVSTAQLEAEIARIDTLQAENVTIKEKLTANEAEIDDLIAENASITGTLTANSAAIENLEATTLKADVAALTYATISDLEATNATIYNLDATYATIVSLEALSAEIDSLDASYANIDFANIGEAAFENFFAKSGMIDNVVIGDSTVTGALISVTIKGDLIEAGTIKADKLIVLGDDGLYYKLNFESGNFTDAEEVPRDALHGSIIAAHSITATQIAVDDLIAFDATIGGFNISDSAIYSGVKESVDNSTRGIYLDKDGQIALGDDDNFLRYYKTTDSDGNEVYKLEISAESILFGANSKSSAADLKELTEHVKIGTYTDPDTGEEEPSVELAEGDSDFKQVITNTKTMFMDGSTVSTQISTDGVETDNVTIKNELRQGQWVWAQRANGNYGLSWKEATS